MMFPVSISPLTKRPARVPIEVMFGWELVCSAPKTLVKLPLVALTLLLKTPTFPDITFPNTLPVTVKLIRVPTPVMFGCEAVLMVPVRLLAVTFPLTFRLPSVPTPVMFGWLAVCKVPVTVVAISWLTFA